jgi:hypothetical protein
MSTVIVDQLAVDEISPLIPLTQLGPRIVKSYRANYTGGQWNPDTNYNWVPGMFYDYTPLLATSRIRVACHIPYAGPLAAHAISHWIFYSNTSTEQGRHSISGEHLEDYAAYMWDFASWGTSVGRIGYQSRSYANDNNEVRVFTTRYWDGGGSTQVCIGQFIIEEYIPGV